MGRQGFLVALCVQELELRRGTDRWKLKRLDNQLCISSKTGLWLWPNARGKAEKLEMHFHQTAWERGYLSSSTQCPRSLDIYALQMAVRPPCRITVESMWGARTSHHQKQRWSQTFPPRMELEEAPGEAEHSPSCSHFSQALPLCVKATDVIVMWPNPAGQHQRKQMWAQTLTICHRNKAHTHIAVTGYGGRHLEPPPWVASRKTGLSYNFKQGHDYIIAQSLIDSVPT